MFDGRFAWLGLLACAGCAPFASLPDPDPVWKSAVQFDEHGTPTRCLRRDDNTRNCSTDADRVRDYIASLLPLSSDGLIRKLPTIEFFCEESDTENPENPTYECSYTKSYVPTPCMTAFRVSVLIRFPEKMAALKRGDLTIHVLTVPDPGYKDGRGCFPL